MKTTHQGQKIGTAKRVADQLRHLWGELEVVDAEKDLRVMILPCDVQKATRKNPACCVFAQAMKRQFAAQKVLFYRTKAYVELPTENGEKRVERFDIPHSMRALVEAFDRGEEVIPEAGFTLKAPIPSERFGSRYDRYRRQVERDPETKRRGWPKTEEDRLKGKTVGTLPELEPVVVDFSVRSGVGKVQFSHKKNDSKAKIIVRD